MHLLMNILAFTISSVLLVESSQLETVFRWKYVDFVWPSAEARERALLAGNLNLTGIVPMDVDVSQDGRVFLSFMNLQGVPARLGYVTNIMGPSGPLVQPYPDWGWFEREDCDTTIQETYRIAIDECNRLWVLDTGHAFGYYLPKCPPKLLAFDLATNTLLTRVNIPNEINLDPKNGATLLSNVIVETSGQNCEATNVYLIDSHSNVLILWDGSQMYRLESPIFRGQKDRSNLTIAGVNKTLGAGIVGMSLSPRIFPDEPRLLHFRPMASYDLYIIDPRDIKQSTKNRSIGIYGKKNVLTSQAIGQAFSSEGVLFFGMSKETGISCWNRYRELAPENIVLVAQDRERLRYINGIKLKRSPVTGVEEVWAISNRWTAFTLELLDYDEFNFHILRAPMKSLIAGTKCEPTVKVIQELQKRRPYGYTPREKIRG